MMFKQTNIDECRTPLVEAVENWKELGRDVPIHDVPYSILHLVSRYFPPQYEWKTFAAHLGIESIQTLNEIEGDARMTGQWPSEVALLYFATPTSTVLPPSFADLVTLLYEKLFRLDALQRLHDSGKVDDFLRERKCKKNSQQQKDRLKFFRHEADRDLLDKLDRMVGNDGLSDVLRSFARKQSKNSVFEQNISAALLTKGDRFCSPREYTVNACQIIESSPNKLVVDEQRCSDQQVAIPSDVVNVLSKPIGNVEHLSRPAVLLTYSSDVENILPELVKRFENGGICVVAEYVLRGKGILEMNPIAAWESLFKQCHFVIPIVSNKYLQEINRPDETVQSQAVRFVYDLYTGKYVSDGCRNHIVRPLVVSDVRPQLLRTVNPTLRMRWRLWEDFEGLLKLIRDGFEARVRRLNNRFKVFRAFPSSNEQLNDILHLNTLHKDLDFWTEPRLIGESVDIMVPPALFTHVVNYIQDSRIHFNVMIEDVHSLVEEQLENPLTSQTQRSSRQFSSPSNGSLSWNKYYRLKDIYAYMSALGSLHPNFVKVLNIGHSTHGQEIKVIKIGFPLKSRQAKPAIWIDAGIHAREWIAPATATYFIDQLVTGVLNNDSNILRYVRKVDWYILPLVNPDGYEYTHTTDRMWRKTRSRHSFFCNGVDPNRNFGFHWNENGASKDACSEIFAGPHAFSEPESIALSQFLMKHNNTIKIYVTMHSYGQFWLLPWGYTSVLPLDYKHLYNLAVEATDALRSVSGTRYKVGTSTNILYSAAGGSDDWAKGVAGIKYSYTVELRDRGHHGFILPTTLIEPTSKETWAAMKVLAEAVIKGLE